MLRSLDAPFLICGLNPRIDTAVTGIVGAMDPNILKITCPN